MIISLYTVKAFSKIQHPFIKRLDISKHNKNKIEQADSPYQIKWRETQSNSTKPGTRQSCPLSLYLFSIVLEILANSIRQQNEIKWIQIWKEEVKLSLVADDMLAYISELKISTRELLELINTFSNVAGYKVS